MTSKPIDDELGELFEGLGTDTAPKKPTTSAAKPTKTSKAKDEQDLDILAELENQLGEKAPERPHTPRVRDTAATSKRTSTNTPPPGVDSTTTTTRQSADSNRSYHASFTPSATSSELQESEKKAPVAEPPAPAASSGGSWWGGLLSTAAAVAKQAEAAVKEIQHTEEAKKWADQVRGNVGALRGLGDGIRQRALPHLADILHTLAPPISSHERLLIHITHDMRGYPSLDPLIHGVFSRVMAQVEGGDLLVIQRGQESTPSRSRSSTSGDRPFFSSHSDAGWRDGPWWRQVDIPRDMGLVKGLPEGTKLCRASAEAYANEYFAANGGIEVARQRAIENASESNPVRTSDLFLSVQAIVTGGDNGLFAGSSASEKEKETSPVKEEENSEDDETVCFAIYILDPVHEIQYSGVSQAIPAKWVRWLDAPPSSATPLTPASGDQDYPEDSFDRNVPEEIREIVEGGGVDPREWVAEWVEEVISLSVGVVAQRYVARRMGVGEGGIGKGKQKVEDILEEGGSEAARAGLI